MSDPADAPDSGPNLPDSDSTQMGPGEILPEGRRRFLKEALAAGGAVVTWGALAPGGAAGAPEATTKQAGNNGHRYHYLAATDKTVHWGYFSKLLKPVVEVESGDFVTIETLSTTPTTTTSA